MIKTLHTVFLHIISTGDRVCLCRVNTLYLKENSTILDAYLVRVYCCVVIITVNTHKLIL